MDRRGWIKVLLFASTFFVLFFWFERLNPSNFLKQSRGNAASWDAMTLTPMPYPGPSQPFFLPILVKRYNSSQPNLFLFKKQIPQNGSCVLPGYIDFAWENVARADSYEFCIDSFNNYRCDTYWISSGKATSVRLSLADLNATYFWQVRALISEEIVEADWGDWWRFHTSWIWCTTPAVTQAPTASALPGTIPPVVVTRNVTPIPITPIATPSPPHKTVVIPLPTLPPQPTSSPSSP